MATAKDCYTLISYYEKVYKTKYENKVTVNKHRARWGFDAMLQGLSPDEIKKLIDYYFTTISSNRHNLDWFFRNYDRLEETKADHEKDAEHRAQLRRESAERAKAWKERIGNQGITSN